MYAKSGGHVIVTKRESYYPHILLIALLWSLVMTFDYYDQKLMAEGIAARQTKQFAECLRGEWRTTPEQGWEIGCMPIEIVKPGEKSE